ncbi:MAG TPA: hypothetical protein VGT08_02055 [Terracidiphilus sp.]|nr:hypothetical protein [Terracidiphilus sp.]
MLDRCLNDVFADFLRNVTRPLLAYCSAHTSQDSMNPAASLRHRDDRGFNRIELLKADLLIQQFAAEFAFEHAIEAYEELIDSTFAEGRR